MIEKIVRNISSEFVQLINSIISLLGFASEKQQQSRWYEVKYGVMNLSHKRAVKGFPFHSLLVLLEPHDLSE